MGERGERYCTDRLCGVSAIVAVLVMEKVGGRALSGIHENGAQAGAVLVPVDDCRQNV